METHDGRADKGTPVSAKPSGSRVERGADGRRESARFGRRSEELTAFPGRGYAPSTTSGEVSGNPMAKRVAAVLAGMVNIDVDPLLYFLDPQMKRQTASEALRADWERVGSDLWKGVAREEADQEAKGLGIAPTEGDATSAQPGH